MPALIIVLFFILGFLAVFYLFVIWRCWDIWEKIPVWQVPDDHSFYTYLSIIIPARNEAEGILPCLESILNQNYPRTLFEVIVIDDHSTDGTKYIVESINAPQIQLFSLADYVKDDENQAYKKQALALGIKKARGELIITTDADCIAPPNWLALIASYYEYHSPKFIAAPVNFFQESSLLERFQSLDFMGMMLLTGAGIHSGYFHMCNGANLAYPRETFFEVGGFKGIDHLASGDDLLLLQKIAARYPGQIGFLKNRAATIATKAKSSWGDFFQQRLRWATKSAHYREWKLILFLALIFLFCCTIVISFVASIIFGWQALVLFSILLLLKSGADYFFLGRAARFFKRTELMSSFAGAQLLHICYITLIGFLSNVVKNYKWKGRKVR